MPRLQINDFSGGLRTDRAQNLIEDNESPIHQNVWTVNSNALTKRNGIDLGFTTGFATSSNDSFSFQRPGSSGSAANIRGYIFNGSTLYETNVGVTSTTSYTNGSRTHGFVVSYNNNLYFSQINTDEGLIQWDGTTFTELTDNRPHGKMVEVYKDSIFTGRLTVPAGTVGLLSRLKWSSTGDPTIWPTNNFTDISPGDGLIINLLKTYRESLYIFKGTWEDGAVTAPGKYKSPSVYRLTGEPSGLQKGAYEIIPIDIFSSFGLVYPKTVLTWNNNLIMFTNNGIYSYDGNSVENLTDKIQTTIDSCNFRYTAGTTAQANANWGQAIVYRDKYWTSLVENTSASGVNTIYVLEKNGSIWRFKMTDPLQSSNHISSFFIGGNGNLYGVLSTVSLTDTQQIFRLNSTSSVDFNTSAINASYTTKEFDFKSPVHFKYAYVDFRGQPNGILNVEFNVDQHGWVQRQVDMHSSYSDIKRSQRLLIGNMGRSIQFRVSNNQAYVNFEIYEIGCEYMPMHDSSEITQARAIDSTSNS